MDNKAIIRTVTITRPPPLGRVRRADQGDMSVIMDLMNEPMRKTFRCETKSDLITLINYSVLAICQLDVGENVVGFLSVKDYPTIPCIHPKAWEEYVWTKYKAVELRARNTLFLHMLCWKPAYAREAVDNMLKTLFMHDAYLDYVAMIKARPEYPLLVPGQSRAEASFRRASTMERGVPGDRLPVLCIAERNDVSPRLRIRRAVEEDNDDIVPIIEKQSPKLQEIYGEFYISELISRHPESERVLLVCEHNELAVGVMCLNTQINYEALEENYELNVFSGLKRIQCYTGLKQGPKIVDTQASLIEFFHPESASSTYYLDVIKDKDGVQSKISLFGPQEDGSITTANPTDEEAILGSRIMSLPPNFVHLFEDEEELEFDIINIDTNLFHIPQLISYDDFAREDSTSLAKIWNNANANAYGEEKIIQKERKKFMSTSPHTEETVRYYGPLNAFLLELFAMQQDYDERYGYDMLEAAFELFPDRDYCVISLPSDHAAFPLLEHFTPVTPCASKERFISDNLYVAHVNSVKGKLKVRPGEPFDIEKIEDILEHTSRRTTLTDLFTASFESFNLHSFVLLSQDLPVGLVIVGPLKDGPSVRTQYALEPEGVGAQTDGAVLAGVISPVFEPHARWYFREVIRQTEFNSLFWICKLIARGESHPKHNLMSLTSFMVPVRSRKPVVNISGNKDLDQINKQVATPFSVWYIERAITSLPKVDVNNSIVVVGASTTGLAFIETLILGPSAPYLTMTNITLVSEYGLPTVVECLKAVDVCMPRLGKYSDRYVKTVPFYYYIDVISSLMVKIDRKNKCIHLKNGGMKHYDQLILTCGQQFQHPEYLQQSLRIEKELQLGKPCERMLMDNPQYLPDAVPLPSEVPDNVMLINSLSEANKCLRRLMRMLSHTQHKNLLSPNMRVVVYGDSLEAYTCITSILELGVSGDKIAFVEPFPPQDPASMRVNCFNDETVDERVQSQLESMGIRIYRKCYFYSWLPLAHGDHVNNLRFISDFHIIQVPCFALFYFGLKAIDINAFKAINECGLVYDGGLVIGTNFETNDPHIYAAGTSTKYSRRLYADRSMHKYYKSEEVGETLAQLYLRKLDPFIMGRDKSTMPDILPHYSSSCLLHNKDDSNITCEKVNNEQPSKTNRWKPVIRFVEPIVTWAVLPGPLYYFKLRSAGPEIPMEVAKTLPRQGHTLITDFKRNYFKLQLNVLHCIESITCLSKEPFQQEILTQLYGKHESYYQSLLNRYEMKMIYDFYSYFRQPWMAALFHETFEDLLDDIRNQDVGTVFDIAKSIFKFPDEKEKSMPFLSTTKVDVPSLGYLPQDAEKLGIFQDIVERFVVDDKGKSILNTEKKVVDVPSECGQLCFVRDETKSFWNAVGGDRIVNAYLGRYLKKYCLANQHYAKTSN